MDQSVKKASGGWGKVAVVLLTGLVVGLLVLHQDWWNWGAEKPLLFGIAPVGLWYHAAYCLAAAVVMWLLVLFAWPKHLEDVGEGKVAGKGGEKSGGHGT